MYDLWAFWRIMIIQYLGDICEIKYAIFGSKLLKKTNSL